MTSPRDKRGYCNSLRSIGIDCNPSLVSYGAVVNHVTAKTLNKVVEGTSDQISLAIKDMQNSMSSLVCMVMDYCLSLDFLLVKK
jgi:hypothetical protein